MSKKLVKLSVIEKTLKKQEFSLSDNEPSDNEEVPSSISSVPPPAESTPFSPHRTSTIASKSVASTLAGCTSLEEKYEALHKDLVERTTWIYPTRNELARVTYELGYYKECFDHINEAKRLVASSSNLLSKSIVYYNYSAFLVSLPQDALPTPLDKTKILNEALSSVEEAIASASLSVNAKSAEYIQDYRVHESSILPYLGRNEDSKDAYRLAFSINPERFIRVFTSDGKGKELIFYSIAQNMDDVFDTLLEFKTSRPDMDIDVNVSSSMGISALLSAVCNGSLTIVQKILELGANPLYKGEADEYPLTMALMKHRLDIAEVIKNFITDDAVKEVALVTQLKGYYHHIQEDEDVLPDEMAEVSKLMSTLGIAGEHDDSI